ncbi:hypothetical protein QQS21_006161 [Conoideocrella luteorostrata]|uniref:Zn(2)-C6 fungal-type domain-containing protein n=1 Tax=Conoideocrella luteorostrata TaxID=1105319 RepID=A0AAJ0CN43_9HYPO|nr:hypothetical protein QQS21_006161 [Conoideocrella luteorostrata]
MPSEPRPPRLRISCVNCTAAKVKCSGEKTGCMRCSKHSLECTYLESKAGRVPRVRRKQQTITELPHDSNEFFSSPYVDPIEIPELNDVGKVGAPFSISAATTLSEISTNDQSGETADIGVTTGHSNMLNYYSYPTPLGSSRSSLSHIFMSQGERETPDVVFPNSQRDMCDAETNLEMPLFTMERAENENSASNMAADGLTEPQAFLTEHQLLGLSASSSQNTTVEKCRDEQCVLTMTRIISALEASLSHKALAVEVVLEIVSTARIGLDGLIDIQQQQHAQISRFVVLFGVVLHQISNLIEMSIETLGIHTGNKSFTTPCPSPQVDTRTPSAILDQLNTINVLISNYKSEARSRLKDDHRAIYVQRISEELECNVQMASRVMKLADRVTSHRQSSELLLLWKSSCRKFLETSNAQLRELQRRL